MAKKQLRFNNNKVISLIILITLLVVILVILIPTILSYIFGVILSSKDGYLLMGFSFCICGSVVIVLLPIIITLLLSPKNNRLNYLKAFFKKYKVISIVFISIILFLEIFVVGRGYIYYRDIEEGSKESIMIDPVVERKRNYRSSCSYIVGYIDGEVIKLEITGDARSKISHNKRYKVIKVKYYKNIKEVYDIDVYASYKK